MHRSKRYINRSNTLCVVFSLFRPIVATECDAASPDVTEASIIAEVCNQTSATGYSTCANQMMDYMQRSATNTCDRYSALSADCLTANDDDRTVCADSLFGYQDCHNYTMQAYAYCDCYYSLPASLADCANEQLQPQPQDVRILRQTSTPVTAVPTSSDMPISAASADKEPTPAFPTVSGGAASSSYSQSNVTFSHPRIPNTPSVRVTSLQEVIPSSDPKTAWTLGAAPSMTSEPVITIVVTHTTTFTATATLTSTPVIISTVYSCTNDGVGGHDIAVPSTPVSAASALIGLEPFASNPAVVAPAPGTEAAKKSETTAITTERGSGSPEPSPPSAPVPTQAQSPGTNTAEGSAEIPSGSAEPSPPSTSLTAQAQSPATSIANGTSEVISGSAIPSPAPSLSTGLVTAPSEATAGRNASAVCASCRRRGRSKIF